MKLHDDYLNCHKEQGCAEAKRKSSLALAKLVARLKRPLTERPIWSSIYFCLQVHLVQPVLPGATRLRLMLMIPGVLERRLRELEDAGFSPYPATSEGLRGYTLVEDVGNLRTVLLSSSSCSEDFTRERPSDQPPY